MGGEDRRIAWRLTSLEYMVYLRRAACVLRLCGHREVNNLLRVTTEKVATVAAGQGMHAG